VLVVGGGPVGLIAAAELCRCGVTSLRIVEKLEKQKCIAKATSIWPRTLELIRHAHPTVYAKMHSYANRMENMVMERSFPAENTHRPLLTFNLGGKYGGQNDTAFTEEQYMTERFLAEELAETFGKPLERGVELVHFQDMGDYVRAELVTPAGRQTVNCKYSYLCMLFWQLAAKQITRVPMFEAVLASGKTCAYAIPEP
jgi:2-polyprenyl-6-methoxyphenol hydroxylase-like FAD-dependent oxidoreductase